jgi:hypothetical protein
MTGEYIAKITIEVGPREPSRPQPVVGPEAFAAVTMALFRLVTAEELHATGEVEFYGRKGDFTAKAVHKDRTWKPPTPPHVVFLNPSRIEGKPDVFQIEETAWVTVEKAKDGRGT